MYTDGDIKEFILELDRLGSLNLKIDEKKLDELVDSYFTGREIYQRNLKHL